MAKVRDDEVERLLAEVVEHFWKEDSATRERQIRQYKKLKLLWEGFTQIWYDEEAHDWRVWDEASSEDSGSQGAYDKPINVFRAYLESIIAALSILVPPIKCYPDDADNTLDLQTAKAGDKIAQLIFRHNNGQLIWLQALFIYCTEGMIAFHNYTKEDEKYGTYTENQSEDEEESHQILTCSSCDAKISDEVITDEISDEYNPDPQMCPECFSEMVPNSEVSNLIVSRLVGITTHPKSRQCIEVYGGLNVKIPNYARRQSDIPYLIQSYETHYALARNQYADDDPELRKKIGESASNGLDSTGRMGRLNPQFQGEIPNNLVTIRNCWLRPSAFQILSDEECDKLKAKFPKGVKIVMVDDICAEYEEEVLDDVWTLTHNPLSDYLTFNPLGLLLVSVQEITNDLISLTLQTIEHGIPQTFADPSVLDFDAYGQTETTPGAIYPARPKIGSDNLGNAFYEVKTATLSQEILPFGQEIQSLGQMVTGALPSLFGGDIQGSKTASQYSMSRAQALQRLQNTWKMMTSTWKDVFGKVIPAYIKDLKEDERFVERSSDGNFVNILIRKAELEGKLGNIELESNENLPVTWNQRKDVIMQLMQANNPQILAMLASPENLPLIYEAIGITDFAIPGEDARNKQYDEIKVLLSTEPLIIPTDPMEIQIGEEMGEPQPEETQEPSVAVEEFDEHQTELAICIKWINSPAGQLAKIENPPGYMNVVLHARAHKTVLDEMMMAAQMANPEGGAPLESPKETDKEAPITGEGDVAVN